MASASVARKPSAEGLTLYLVVRYRPGVRAEFPASSIPERVSEWLELCGFEVVSFSHPGKQVPQQKEG